MDLGVLPMSNELKSFMFVCLGNICRSPTAEGVLLSMAREKKVDAFIHVESSGLGTWHLGELPDPRARAAASQRGVELISRAQQFRAEDFQRFDYILGADDEVVAALKKEAPNQKETGKVQYITFLSSKFPNMPIPDPYLGGDKGFSHVLDMIEDACSGIINKFYVTEK